MPRVAPPAYRITDLTSSERPHERLAELGAQALSTAELLAILLRVGTHVKIQCRWARPVARPGWAAWLTPRFSPETLSSMAWFGQGSAD
jgi:DNA repair protein RadC